MGHRQCRLRALVLRATGSVVKFDGFLKLYQEGRDDEADEDAEGRRLPGWPAAISTCDAQDRRCREHFTEPPPRLFGSLPGQEDGGARHRPALDLRFDPPVLRDRGYAPIDKSRLIPEDKGRVVVAFLENFFARYVEYDFTADLEEQPTCPSPTARSGRARPAARLLARLHRRRRRHQGSARHPGDQRSQRSVWRCISSGRSTAASIRASARCAAPASSRSSSASSAPSSAAPTIRTAKFTRPITARNHREAPADGIELGFHPETGDPVTLRRGRFGPYVQLGEAWRRARMAKSLEPQGEPGCPGHRARVGRPRTSRSGSSRCCRARSAIIRTHGSRSSPTSAASDPSCCTTGLTPILDSPEEDKLRRHQTAPSR